MLASCMVVPPLLPVPDGVRLCARSRASPVPVLEGLPPLRDDRLPTQRFRPVSCHQHMEAGVRPGILSVLAVPSSLGHVWWCSAPALSPCLRGEHASSVSSWQRQTSPLRRQYTVI